MEPQVFKLVGHSDLTNVVTADRILDVTISDMCLTATAVDGHNGDREASGDDAPRFFCRYGGRCT